MLGWSWDVKAGHLEIPLSASTTTESRDGATRRAITRCPSCDGRRIDAIYAVRNIPVHSVILMSSREEAIAYPTGDLSLGFCNDCGSILFWEQHGSGEIAIAAGTLESSVDIETIAHVFVNDKADFYEIRDDLQQFPGSAGGTISVDS